MIENIITLRELVASEGHVLTNGREYSKKIYLGVNDSADNWHEITDAEYDEVIRAMEQQVEENM